MFDRFVRLAQARKALREGHFEEAVRLADDPLVRGHRRADEVRRAAIDGLVGRARQRADAGGLSAALRDCDRALELDGEHSAARELRDVLRRRVEDDAGRTESVRSLCREGRRALERGELDEAQRLADAAAALEDGAAVADLRARVHAQRERATGLCAAAAAARADGRLDQAAEALGQARALDVGHRAGHAEAARLAAAWASTLRSRIEDAMAADGAAAARAVWSRHVALQPELGEQPHVREALARIERDDRRRIVDLLQAGDVDGAVEQARRGGCDGANPIARVVEQLARARELARTGELGEAADLVCEVAGDLGIAGLAGRAEQWRGAAERVDLLLRDARAAAAEGRLVEARRVLLEVVEAHPGHAAARREIELLDQGSEDRARRMADARAAARDGRLREATAAVVTLAVPGVEGDEARILLRDLQQRMDTVAAGVRQVLRALHGRDSGSRDGLEHCAKRLDELAKVQADSDELETLRAATAAEIQGLDRAQAARAALLADDVGGLRDAMQALAELRPRLLAPDRLDARALEVVDAAAAEAERCVAAARPTRAEALIDALRPWSGEQGRLGGRLDEIQARVAERQVRAAHHAAAAEAALERRDPAAAEEALEAARRCAADDPAVGRVEAALAGVRRQGVRLQEVEDMAGKRDFDGANRELDKLGPTPSLMRTRIYDLRRSLAAAQGLAGPFLLRVDEGGEYLVVRGESLTIGNLRDGGSDLPMLANLAGRHARLRRTMSFHGGQEDRLEAERGEVSVGGHPVASVRLESGLRVRLGSSVEFVYRLPSERSLTALLSIRGGFQVAGTDSVLWMKDRGRDGRILIGAGTDCHVQVQRATSVVEIFAGRDGQLRVRCDAGGEIDGRPFQGEHPVTAGAPIVCGGVTLVLQPWNRA